MNSLEKLVLLVVCLLFASLSAPVYSQTTYHVSSAGALKNLGSSSISNMTLTGEIDARDIAFIRDRMPNLATLDLSGVTIMAYTGTDGTSSSTISISYPANEMPSSSFYNKTSLKSIVLPNGLTSIGVHAFYGCSYLTDITFPAGIAYIEGSAFENCGSLTDIILPDELIIIGSSAFRNCRGLTNITLPPGLTSIGNYAFFDCYFYLYVTNLNPIPIDINNYIFNQTVKPELRVPASSVDAYKKANIWGTAFNITGGTSFIARTNNAAYGAVTGTSNGVYVSDTVISLKAIPANGYSFMGWTSGRSTLFNLISPELTYNFNLTSDTVIIAIFGKSDTCNLTEAGTLKNVPNIKTVTHLTLTGNIDASDIAFMRDSIPYLAETDLSEATIVAYSGTGGTVKENTSYPANEMPRYSFYYSSTSTGKASLKSIVLPNGLTSIEMAAFYHCLNLMDITFPAGLTSIGSSAFSYCSNLTDITFPAGLTSIGSSAFVNCSNLKDIIFPAGLTSIGQLAFYNCSNLKDITFPDGLTSIGNSTFYGCSSLTYITLPDGLTSIGQSAFRSCNSLTDITIPYGVTFIGDHAFADCRSLTEVNLPAGLTSISDAVFFGCSSLTEINLPAGLTSIEGAAFSGCSSLTEINLPTGLTSIGYGAFSSCFSLTDINLPAGLTSIGEQAFLSCFNLTEINFPDGLTSIERSAFYGCSSLTEINLPAGLTSIESSAFSTCRSLTEITIPAGVTSIESSAFNNCSSLTEITLPAGLNFIGSGAFSGTDLRYITNLNPVPVNIDGSVFNGVNKSVCELTVPSSSVADYQAASVWEDFYSITGGGLSFSVKVNNGIMGSITGQSSGLYPNGTAINLMANIAAGYIFFGWTSEGTTVETEVGYDITLTENIAVTAVFGKILNTSLTSAGTLKDVAGIETVTHLTVTGEIDTRDIAFIRDHIPYLVELDLSGATIIACEMYSGTNSGQESTAPDIFYPANEMPNNSFGRDGKGKTPLTSVILPEGLTSIRGNAFFNCSSLTEITLPDGLTSIEGNTFSGCNSLTEITIPDGVASIGESAFYGCISLTEINLPAGLTSIESSAFDNCSSLTEITIPAGLNSIGSGAFSGTGLTSITNLNPVPANIDGSVFDGVDKNVCKLTVPSSSVADYQSASGWEEFYNIIGGGLSFNVNVNNAAMGSVAGQSSGLYPSGTAINLTANPASGYSFLGWTSGGTTVETGTGYDITLTENVAITAVFWKPLSANPTSAGTLKDVASIKNVTHLTLTGEIDARDIAFIRDRIPYLVELDLSGATIVEYNGTEGTFPVETFYPANEMPEFSFFFLNNGRGKTSLTSIILPDGVTSIGWHAFRNCSSLTEINIPAGVISIGEAAFSYCSLTNITLPAGVTSIGQWAFSVTDLRYITNLNPVPATIDSDVFGGVDKSVCELKVPSSSVADYQAADVWKEFYNIIGINEEYTVTLTADNGTVTGDGVYPAGVNATVTAIPNTGYGFVNWTVEGTPISSSNPFVFEVTSDTLIHANFEAIAYNIAYELNGGTNHADNPVTYTIESPLITLQVPTHEGYTFTDWTEGDTIAAGSVGNKTFTAQWSSPIVYDITYELNGGTNPDGNPAEYTVEDAITLQDPTLTGYDFTGWLPDGKITVGSTGDRTFTAQWSPTVYGITYVLDGGDNHVDNPDSYTIKSSVTLKDPVREGFVFESWAEGNEIEQGSMGDKTFTALWKCTEANIEEIIINGTATAEISAVNDSVFEYTAQECDETSISLDLGASSQATVTINGDTYAPGTEIVFDEGDLTTVKIEVKPETGDNDKTYTLKIAAPITNNSLYYQRWDDVIAINQNPATNGGYDVSEIRWHKPDGTVDNSEFISISSVENSDNYYAEVKTVETDVWHHVCATIETKTSEKITAYPNPVSHGEKVTVNLPTSYVNGALNIYDIRGGLVKSELPLPTKVNSIDMSEFVPGIYLLRITDKKGNSKTVKIIKN